MDESKRFKWAEFRFKVIAPLVCRRLEEEERRILRRAILERPHMTPDGEEVFVAERTLRAWVAKHRLHGIDGLKRMTPPTKGEFRAIPECVLDKAEHLRRERPTRSVKTILSLLKADSVDISGISKSTLNYHLNLRGAIKEKNYSERGTFQRFQKEHANDLWQADTTGAFWLPDPLNPAKAKQCKLIGFIDDATRVVAHAQFFFDEQVPSLMDCFRKALLSRGRARALYTDNGKGYLSKALERCCAELGIELLHAEDYCPEGKGKIEKYLGGVKSRFYGEAQHCGLTSLAELNTFFFAWLEQEYHCVEHEALGMSPFARWQQDEEKGFIRMVTADEIRHALMLRDERTVNKRTATISLNNRMYRVGKELAGKKVEVLWEADRLNPTVEIWHDGKLVELAHELVPGTDIDYALRPNRERKPGPPAVLESSKKYQRALVAAYQPKSLTGSSYLAETEFLALVSRLLERELMDEDKKYLSDFFHELSPLTETVTESTLQKAVTANGTMLHLHSYCNQLKQAILSQRRK